PARSASAGRRRPATSRVALPATHRSNRSRTARKPNFNATATGSVCTLLLQLEAQPGQSEGQLVAGLQDGLLHAPAVDLDAVGGAKVGHDPAPVLVAKLRVAARRVRVLERDVTVAAAPDQHAAAREHRALALAH